MNGRQERINQLLRRIGSTEDGRLLREALIDEALNVSLSRKGVSGEEALLVLGYQQGIKRLVNHLQTSKTHP